ncbi:MAG TPA: CehA/McbA family metallohydrolase [Gemmataceae bacterium]|nr:CehA/McbA family metallohydrolase [Gemmataceae bacterium]
MSRPTPDPVNRREFLGMGGLALGGLGLAGTTAARAADGTVVRGEVTDAATGKPISCRVYVEGEDGTWHFPRSEAKGGSAVEYRKQRPDNPRSVEMHTTLSAHPFLVTLPLGRYTFTVERGKEHLPETQVVTVGKDPVDLRFKLKRWIDMAARGWYSGETHVHRDAEELPTLMLAEDLNVTFPLSYWVTEAFASPKTARKGPFQGVDARAIPVDPTHVIYPLNTEYELFTVEKKPHTLGAFFALNHRTVLDTGAPPVRPIAERVHKEGGLIELDKHNWPWSMALVPVMQVDLFELANNHVWRTEFAFGRFGEPAPEYMKVEHDRNGFTERGWLDYGFQNYYALLNCGFRLRPTAGTASGVHPVPLGFGRVYVHCPDGFGYDAWVRGLDRGESFVTTGPMLLVRVNGKTPGATFQPDEGKQEHRVTGEALSPLPLDRVELVVNGAVARAIRPANRPRDEGGYVSTIDERLMLEGSAWLAIRCSEALPNNRIRFAHTAPWHVRVPGRPLRPRAEEIDFLIRRVEEQLARSKDVLPPAALDEYRDALKVYRDIKKSAGGGQ